MAFYINATGLKSAAGPTVADLWATLMAGKCCLIRYPISSFNSLMNSNFVGYWRDISKLPVMGKFLNYKSADEVTDLIVQSLVQTCNEAEQGLAKALGPNELGVIFASTKGAIEGQIWKTSSLDTCKDPYSEILNKVLGIKKLRPSEKLTISNACSSTHAALWLADKWMKQGRCKQVLVLCADLIGPFVLSGFHSLKALSEAGCTPFGENRDGLSLGEATAALILSSSPENDNSIYCSGIDIFNESTSITRPSGQGEGLKKVVQSVLGQAGKSPDLIIAHATGTKVNDKIEDAVYFDLFQGKVPTIGTKWSVGHCLGASGAIDVIAGQQILLHQKIFGICSTQKLGRRIKSQYFLGKAKESSAKSILINSLGFGGTQASIMLERR